MEIICSAYYLFLCVKSLFMRAYYLGHLVSENTGHSTCVVPFWGKRSEWGFAL